MQRRADAERVSQAKLARIDEAHDVAGEGFVDGLAIGSEDPVDAAQAEGLRAEVRVVDARVARMHSQVRAGWT